MHKLIFFNRLHLNYLDGVSTLDLVRIQRHILGIQPFKNKYNLAAADCNDNGSVTASDLAELRKLLLGITSKLPAPTHRFLWEDNPYDGTNSEILSDIVKYIKKITLISILSKLEILQMNNLKSLKL